MKTAVLAYRVYEEKGGVLGRLEEVYDQDPGEVRLRVHYSSVNYKDALGASGRGKIYKKFPIIAGIDAAGVVEESADRRFKAGDRVVVTGCGFGESRDGGFAREVCVPADWLVPLPSGLSLREAMALGTAGFTAALCLQRMEDNGQSPDKGPIVVSGATGGVGSLAINILATAGYEVHAVSGKTEQHDYLRSLGAVQVLEPSTLAGSSRPLETVRWAGAIDNVGGAILTALLPRIGLWGNVAAVGLALSPELHTTVMPFILRGVSLLGTSSTNCPHPLRTHLWQRLAAELKPRALDAIVKAEIGLADLDAAFAELLTRQSVGRYVVNCQK